MPSFRKQFASHWLQCRSSLQAIGCNVIASESDRKRLKAMLSLPEAVCKRLEGMPWLVEAIGPLPVAANRFHVLVRLLPLLSIYLI
jgi:hypothetical protein